MTRFHGELHDLNSKLHQIAAEIEREVLVVFLGQVPTEGSERGQRARAIRRLQREIDEQACAILSMKDLGHRERQRIVTSIAIAHQIEKMSTMLAAQPVIGRGDGKPDIVARIARDVVLLMSDAMACMEGASPVHAERALLLGELIDSLQRQAKGEIVHRMKKDSAFIETGLEQVAIVRLLAHVAESALRIADDALFVGHDDAPVEHRAEA